MTNLNEFKRLKEECQLLEERKNNFSYVLKHALIISGTALGSGFIGGYLGCEFWDFLVFIGGVAFGGALSLGVAREDIANELHAKKREYHELYAKVKEEENLELER